MSCHSVNSNLQHDTSTTFSDNTLSSCSFFNWLIWVLEQINYMILSCPCTYFNVQWIIKGNRFLKSSLLFVIAMSYDSDRLLILKNCREIWNAVSRRIIFFEAAYRTICSNLTLDSEKWFFRSVRIRLHLSSFTGQGYLSPTIFLQFRGDLIVTTRYIGCAVRLAGSL